jgi:hypothetical protein
LDGKDWGEPAFNSYVVRECYRLRRVPLQELGIENLRVLIGQQSSLEYLIPLAIERLRDDPLAEGDFGRGDLLVSVLRADSKFLVGQPDYRRSIAEIISRALPALATLEEYEREAVEKALHDALDIFGRADYFAKYGRC